MSGLKSPKKKFFDDDDFFVIKKAKKLKSVDSPKPEQHPQPKNKERSQLPIISQIPSDEATPNNNLQQFYSADEFLPTPVEDLTTTRDIASLLQTENKPQQENTIDIVDDDSEQNDEPDHPEEVERRRIDEVEQANGDDAADRRHRQSDNHDAGVAQ